MEVMIASKKKMSELCEGLTVYPQVLVNVKVKDKAAVLNDPDVAESIKKAENEIGSSGRILVRESGTEALIRVMAEAETEEICRRYVDGIVKTITDKGHTV